MSATRTTVAVFGTIAAAAGLEHGVGEVLQGNVRPPATVFMSWTDSPFFRILGGEPAMSLVPNLLVSGVLTILLSLVLLVWVLRFVHRPGGGLVLIGISIALLLVGGGFGPPALGIILGVAASRIRSPHRWALRSERASRLLSSLWPIALFGGLAAWLMLMPGVPLLAYTLHVDNAALVIVTFFAALGLLLASVFSGYARDANPASFRTALSK